MTLFVIFSMSVGPEPRCPVFLPCAAGICATAAAAAAGVPTTGASGGAAAAGAGMTAGGTTIGMSGGAAARAAVIAATIGGLRQGAGCISPATCPACGSQLACMPCCAKLAFLLSSDVSTVRCAA